MQQSDALTHYLLNALPVALALALLFFLLGIAIGWLLWRSRRERVELAELANVQLREEQDLLAQRLKRARNANQ